MIENKKETKASLGRKQKLRWGGSGGDPENLFQSDYWSQLLYMLIGVSS